MKVAFIGQKGIPAKFGGVEKHVEDLSRRLAAGGHEVFVYTRPNYTEPALTSWHGVTLISLPSIGTKHLDAITHTFRAILDVIKRDVDIIHFHSIGPSSLVWLVKLLRPDTPVVATFHAQCYTHQKWGAFAKLYLKLSEAICCTLPDRTLAVSRTLKKYAEKTYGKEIFYVPNGVEAKNETGTEELARWGLTSGNYILAVSRLVKHKGLHYLIKAYQGIPTDKKLVIVGGGAFTDKYVSEFKALAATDDRVIFTGIQNGAALEQLFANAYLFVQPSESEGLSIALLEAMAFGRAVLASDIPENLEVVGENGLTFRSKSIRDLREKLAELLPQTELMVAAGSRNREQVRQRYDWGDITAEIVKIYEQLSAEKKRRHKFERLRTAGRLISLLF